MTWRHPNHPRYPPNHRKLSRDPPRSPGTSATSGSAGAAWPAPCPCLSLRHHLPLSRGNSLRTDLQSHWQLAKGVSVPDSSGLFLTMEMVDAFLNKGTHGGNGEGLAGDICCCQSCECATSRDGRAGNDESGRGSQVRSGLAAGGSRLRTLGPRSAAGKDAPVWHRAPAAALELRLLPHRPSVKLPR
jgi:hypothetical protein